MKVKNLKIRLNRVMQVYSGRPGCMCGCLGNYRVAKEHLVAANITRGYDHDPSDVNDRQVRRVVKILEAQAGVDVDPSYVFAEVDGRYYAAYFVPTHDELKAILARRAEVRKAQAAKSEKQS